MKTKLNLVGGSLANSLIAHRILVEFANFPLLVAERRMGASLAGRRSNQFNKSVRGTLPCDAGS